MISRCGLECGIGGNVASNLERECAKTLQTHRLLLTISTKYSLKIYQIHSPKLTVSSARLRPKGADYIGGSSRPSRRTPRRVATKLQHCIITAKTRQRG